MFIVNSMEQVEVVRKLLGMTIVHFCEKAGITKTTYFNNRNSGKMNSSNVEKAVGIFYDYMIDNEQVDSSHNFRFVALNLPTLPPTQ